MTSTNGAARHAAVAAWQESAAAGVALSGAELAERFGRSPSWGRGVAREARREPVGTQVPVEAPVSADTGADDEVPNHGSEPAAATAAQGGSRLDLLVTLAVAVVAAAASYGHMYDVAMLAGEPLWIARAFPLTVDGLVIAALRRGETGRRWLVLGLAVSVAANVVAKYPNVAADAGPVVSAWPPLALYGTHRLLTRKAGRS